jgi:heat shock protein HslJ
MRTSRPRGPGSFEQTGRALGLTMFLAVLLLAACGSGEGDDGSGAPAATTPELAGKTYTSTAVEGHELVAGSTVGLTFTDAGISANAGCNTMSGAATWTGGMLSVDGDKLATTQMACDDALMQQDTWLSGFLTSDPKLTVGGGQMLLEGSGVKMTLEEKKPVPLAGTDWTLTGTVNNDAVSSIPTGVKAGITLPAGGTTIEVQAGCNTGSVTVAEVPEDSATTGTLDVTPGPLTRKMCSDDAMQVEQQVIGVLDGEITYTIDGSTLTLTNGDLGLVFEAKPAD